MSYNRWGQIAEFRAVLKSHGRLSTMRESKGSEEMGACGQLGDLAMARRFRARGEDEAAGKEKRM